MEDEEEIFETLEEAREKMDELKQQRDRLLTANRKIVKVLAAMEEDMKDAGMDTDEMNEYTYSFHRGWKNHREELEIDDISVDSVDRQLEHLDRLFEDMKIL